MRETVHLRAHGACEYCRLPQEASILPHQVDHIIGRQHRGSDDVANLCLCCVRCNLKKGPNIASIDPENGAVVALYHPRQHSWQEHFLGRARWHHRRTDGRGTRHSPAPGHE
ncbi:HNH endonuclease [Sorangium sp. So ce1128]